MIGSRVGVGRRKVNFEQTPLRLPEGTLGKVDGLLGEGEKRADFLRAAVEAEVERRERARLRSQTQPAKRPPRS